MTDPSAQARKRALQYWHIDGLTEIAMGGILLVLSAFFTAQASLPRASLLYQIVEMSFVLLLVGAGAIAGRFVSLFKQRITYPRTGFVSYKPAWKGRRWVGAVLAMLIASISAGLVASAPASLAWMPAISGIILSAVLLFLGVRFELLRFYLLSLISLATGVGLSLAGIGNINGLAVYYAIAGLSILLSGGLTLWIYLRKTTERQP